ncbi:MAG: hypothetical protein GX282_07330 [Campylobacteraceae bacterium]|nr:hypothetical protein [Campylobacteraceae bacterium]
MADKLNKEVYIQDDEIDLGALFKTIFDYKHIVIGITLVFMVLGVFYASMQTKWFKTIAVVEVGHTMVNNEKNYITSYNKFSNDVLSLGASVIDDENTVFKSISVDHNITLDDEDILILGNGFYAISLVGSDKDASTSEINKIIDSIVLEHKIDLEYAMR